MNENFKVTKSKRIKTVINDMEYNFYFLNYIKIYNDDNTRYYHFKFVTSFDIYDLYEFYEDKESFSKSDIKQYNDEIASSFIYSYKFDYNNHDEFYRACCDTIYNYNNN